MRSINILVEHSGGSRISQAGVEFPTGRQTVILANFPQKLHKNEKICRAGASLAPPGSANASANYKYINSPENCKVDYTKTTLF